MAKKKRDRFMEFLEEVAAADSDWEYGDGQRMNTDAAAHLSAYRRAVASVTVLEAKLAALQEQQAAQRGGGE